MFFGKAIYIHHSCCFHCLLHCGSGTSIGLLDASEVDLGLSGDSCGRRLAMCGCCMLATVACLGYDLAYVLWGC